MCVEAGIGGAYRGAADASARAHRSTMWTPPRSRRQGQGHCRTSGQELASPRATNVKTMGIPRRVEDRSALCRTLSIAAPACVAGAAEGVVGDAPLIEHGLVDTHSVNTAFGVKSSGREFVESRLLSQKRQHSDTPVLTRHEFGELDQTFIGSSQAGRLKQEL